MAVLDLGCLDELLRLALLLLELLPSPHRLLVLALSFLLLPENESLVDDFTYLCPHCSTQITARRHDCSKRSPYHQIPHSRDAECLLG